MLNFSGDVFKIINEKRGQTRSSFGNVVKCGQAKLNIITLYFHIGL